MTKLHAAYAALTHGLISKWTYLSLTITNIGHLVQPLEDVIQTTLILALTRSSPPSESERDLFALPAIIGGLGLINPTCITASEYSALRDVTQPLRDLILDQDPSYPQDISENKATAKAKVCKCKCQLLHSSANHFKSNLPSPLLR